jgi:hypothetical protein
MQDVRSSWFPLDNAAKIFPPALSGHFTTVFRIAAVLTRPVHATHLQNALEALLPRFPVFRVHLKKGLFWYYLEENEHRPLVYPETRYPCMWRPTGGSGVFPFRVKAHGRRVALEVSHMITDGFGALSFLRALLGEYFQRRGFRPDSWGDLARPGEVPATAELEDSFLRAFDPRVPDAEARPPAYHLRLPITARGAYYVTSGVVSAAAVRDQAKRFGVRVTDYLLAQLFATYQDVATELLPNAPPSVQRPIRVLVPVNLRPVYNSVTTRNFFVFVEPEIDLRLGEYEFDELVQRAYHSMRLQTTAKNLSTYVSRNVRPESRLGMRLIPRGAKDLALSYAHKRYGERSNTGSLSNLGRVDMPEGLRHGISHFEFVPIPSRNTKINCAVISYGDAMTISFGKMTESRIVERTFFRRLRRLGIDVRIITNDDRLVRPASEEEGACRTAHVAE